jgi:crotonobetainyl-CoA:carnitine CoA-transferase CaiB-like acyl-CoA transferase
MGTPLPRWDRTKAGNPMFNNYRAADGHWLQLAVGASDLQWADFCRMLETPELENDPRFADMDKRAANAEALIEIFDEAFAGRTRDEWEKRLREGNFIHGRIQSPVEVTTDPQAIANDFFAELDHPAAGPMKLLNTPVKFLPDAATVRTPAPEIGQHTEEVLLAMGYAWEDISRLKEEGVIL